jgi:cytochrome c
MKKLLNLTAAAAVIGSVFVLSQQPAHSDEFTQDDVNHWMDEYLSVVQEGRALWVDGNLGTNGVACAQCHPNAANTHPETYPKYQKQLGRVASMREMINWCIQNPLEGEKLALDDPKMIAMEAYVTYERRGVELAPGKH